MEDNMTDMLRFNIGGKIVEVPKTIPEQVRDFILDSPQMQTDEPVVSGVVSRKGASYLTPERTDELIKMIFGKEVFDYWAKHRINVAPYMQAVFKAWELPYYNHTFNLN